MKKSFFSLFPLFLWAILFSSFFPRPDAWAEDPLLKIQVLPDQNSVKSGMMFLVHVQVSNASSDTSTEFWTNSCSYEKHWVTDNAEVLIQAWTCNENSLEQVTLEPGDSYEKNIILYIPKKDKTGPVEFRLGFQRMSEDGEVAEPLWSDPITMDVVVPEEMKEAAPSSHEKATADTAFISPEGQNQISTAETPPLVFRDPRVPIRIPSGEEFSIVLGSNPSTGFHWKMTLPEEQKTLKFLGSRHVNSQEVMPGAPGDDLFKFKAMTAGEVKADFVYNRPWETKTAPVRKIFTIVVQDR